jgi:hypothetical protein
MSFMAEALRGKQIDDVLADTEGVYITLSDGTLITIRGLVHVQPAHNVFEANGLFQP